MNKKILSAISALCVLLTVTGCGNNAPATTTAAPAETTTAETTTTTKKTTAAEDDYEDDDEEDDASWLDDDDESGDSEKDSGEEKDSKESGSASSDAEIIANGLAEFYGYPYNFAGGTAKTLDGNIAIVSVFVTTEEFPWDFEEIADTDAYLYYLNDLNIAVNYLTEKAQEYGKSPNFIWDWSEYEDLCSYSATNLIEPIKGDKHYGLAWQHITADIDTAAILKETDAQQIIYIFVYNTPPEYEPMGEYHGPYCQVYSNEEEEKEKAIDPNSPPDPPYETIYLTMGYYDGQPQYCTPATIAHEILHAFGASDLYKDADSAIGNDYMYGISKEYIKKINDTEPLNDIMRCPESGESGNYDSITSEITDITAYYVGLTDSSETVDQWGFDKREEYSF